MADDILWSFPRVFGEESASPFCVKLETWMRLRGIPYTRRRPSGPPRSRTGKLPSLERPDGTILSDSEVIAGTLAAEHGVDPYEGIAPADRPVALLARRTLEEHLYWGVVHDRWARPEGWAVYRPALFGGLPLPVRGLVSRIARRKALAGLHGHGLSRQEPDARDAMLRDDVEALAAVLGDRDWWLSDRPTLLDATAFGMFGAILSSPVDTPLRRAVRDHPNLVAHVARVREAAW